ncbi:MAG TPA: ABC transporter ATP-binding protein [Geobacteraceae bacterium]
MSTVITVENLGKQYVLNHRAKQESYVALRDVLSDGVRNWGRRLVGRGNTAGYGTSQEEFWALTGVSFEVKQGDRIGVIGRNGAGKSTLLKILSRITEPSVGRVRIRGRVASLLEVGTGFHPELTGRENIFLNGAILGMSRAEIKKKFDEIVDFAEMEKFLDTPVKRYSSGMYVRLAFAVAAHLEPEILIVDEVLAVGDTQFQKKCLGKMEEVSSKEGRTILFVSHNMTSIESLCTETIYLNNGIADGPLSIWDGIHLYLEQSQKNEATFDDKIIKQARVSQLNDCIEICAEFEMNDPIKTPCLGFVISDYFGAPICGTNPVIDKVDFEGNGYTKGTVRVIVEQPKLLNGTYRLSLWFGDGKDNLFEEKDCLTFEVISMTNKLQLPLNSVGPVFPTCKWIFS